MVTDFGRNTECGFPAIAPSLEGRRHFLRSTLHTGMGAAAALGTAGLSLPLRAGQDFPNPCDRYVGYRGTDFERPWAKYFTPRVDRPQFLPLVALFLGPIPTPQVPEYFETLGSLNSRGYQKIESGYGLAPSGQVYVACYTKLKFNRPEMWDWWFGWHSDDSTKYKLWHPEDHQYAGIANDLTDAPVSDKQKYIGNRSFVDELIGDQQTQLTISFVSPEEFGIDLRTFDGTAICARVGSSLVPADAGILVHQIRPTVDGAEMRSRFYLNVFQGRTLDEDARACALERGQAGLPSLPFDTTFAAKLLRHNAEEMNHLGRRLPFLYAEFAKH